MTSAIPSAAMTCFLFTYFLICLCTYQFRLWFSLLAVYRRACGSGSAQADWLGPNVAANIWKF